MSKVSRKSSRQAVEEVGQTNRVPMKEKTRRQAESILTKARKQDLKVALLGSRMKNQI